MNSTKHINANIKDITAIVPDVLFPALQESMAINNGTNSSSIKPIAEPTSCIPEAVVTTSFVSFTLKNQVNIQAMANIPMNDPVIMLNGFDTSLYRL